MPERQKEFFKRLGDEDRISNRLELNGHFVLEFSVALEIYYNNEWIHISRIDSSDSATHRHTFHANSNKELRVAFHCNTLSEGFTAAQKYFTENFGRIRDSYLTQASKKRNNIL